MAMEIKGFSLYFIVEGNSENIIVALKNCWSIRAKEKESELHRRESEFPRSYVPLQMQPVPSTLIREASRQ